jgi:hypothetical protein
MVVLDAKLEAKSQVRQAFHTTRTGKLTSIGRCNKRRLRDHRRRR